MTRMVTKVTLDNVIEIKKPDPDSQYRLKPCKKCKSDNVAYAKSLDGLWRVRCFDCGCTVGKGNKIRHDAQLEWNKEMRL